VNSVLEHCPYPGCGRRHPAFWVHAGQCHHRDDDGLFCRNPARVYQGRAGLLCLAHSIERDPEVGLVVAMGQLIPLGDGLWRVGSDSTPGQSYLVQLADDGAVCDCLGNRNGSRKDCKHIDRARRAEERLVNVRNE
jgi:hypothetical protein